MAPVQSFHGKASPSRDQHGKALAGLALDPPGAAVVCIAIVERTEHHC
jgi:hypothetical protein